MRISIGAGLAALALWASVLALEYRRELRTQQQRVQTGSRVLHTACGAIEVAESGPADAPALLLIHGSGGGFDQGLMLAQDLAPPSFASSRRHASATCAAPCPSTLPANARPTTWPACSTCWAWPMPR